MKPALSCFTFLALLLTIGCSSAMPHSNNNGRSSVVISSISLSSVSSGAQDFTLTIVGSGFPASPSTTKDHPSVLWGVGSQNGVYLDIDFAQCDATHIIATVPADLVQNAGTFDIQVQIFHFADDIPKAASNIFHLVVGSGSGSWDY
jgi:hypothetical protein